MVDMMVVDGDGDDSNGDGDDGDDGDNVYGAISFDDDVIYTRVGNNKKRRGGKR